MASIAATRRTSLSLRLAAMFFNILKMESSKSKRAVIAIASPLILAEVDCSDNLRVSRSPSGSFSMKPMEVSNWTLV